MSMEHMFERYDHQVLDVRTPPLGSPRDLSESHSALAGFHPAVAEWFARRFPEVLPKPRPRWALIARGLDTLIAAPPAQARRSPLPGAIDSLYKAHAAGEDVSCVTRVVYVSPLKAWQ